MTGAQIRTLLRKVTAGPAATSPQSVPLRCTNLNGAPLVDELERETGLPVYDSVAEIVWRSMKLAGVDTRRLAGWGRLFRNME